MKPLHYLIAVDIILLLLSITLIFRNANIFTKAIVDHFSDVHSKTKEKWDKEHDIKHKTNLLYAAIISIFGLSLLAFFFCLQNHVFFITNHSSKDAYVEVFTVSEKLRKIDSVEIIHDMSPNYRVRINKNEDLNSYSFILLKGHDAIIQNGTGTLDLSGKIVINKSDTIMLRNSNRVFLNTVIFGQHRQKSI